MEFSKKKILIVVCLKIINSGDISIWILYWEISSFTFYPWYESCIKL